MRFSLSPSVTKQAKGTSKQKRDATGLRNTCYAEAYMEFLFRRWGVVVAVGGHQDTVGAAPVAATHATRRIPIPCIYYRLVPLPYIAALIERTVGTGRILEIAGQRSII
jgi:hypothetical protein